MSELRRRRKQLIFDTLGVATFDEKDDLQTIKGIGPFIADKLYTLGIYTFAQVGRMRTRLRKKSTKQLSSSPVVLSVMSGPNRQKN